MKKIITLIFLIGLILNSFAQKKELYNNGTNKGVKAKPAKQLEKVKSKINGIIGIGAPSNQSKYTHIYLIVYKDKNGNHLRKPKKVYRSKGESEEFIINKVAKQEKGNYQLNTDKVINKDNPYGLLCSRIKKGEKIYQFGVYETYKKAEYWRDDNERFGKECDEIISLN